MKRDNTHEKRIKQNEDDIANLRWRLNNIERKLFVAGLDTSDKKPSAKVQFWYNRMKFWRKT